MGLKVLPATLAHQEAIRAIIPRLTEFGVPTWRNAGTIERATQGALEKWFADPTTDATVLVALDGAELLGFIHVETEQDFLMGPSGGMSRASPSAKTLKGKV